MSKTVVRKNEDPQMSMVNFLIGTAINPGFGLLWSQTDMPTQRDRIYTLYFSDGTQEIVDVSTFNKYRVGDTYP